MKKCILFAAVAVAAMASCSKSETIQTGNDDAIKFETYFHKTTRAAVTTAATLGQFTVTALDKDGNPFINKQTVTVASGGSCSNYGTYYWPSDGSNLDFFAWGPSTDAQIAADADKFWNKFVVTPSTTIASQVDFVFARTQGNKAANATTGVVCNFRHAESQVQINVKNSNKDLEFDITNWKVVNVATSGTYTNAADNTDGNDDGKLAYSAWSGNTTYTGSYTGVALSTAVTKSGAIASAEAVSGFQSMILVPQKVTKAADAYSAATSGAAMNGSYIAVEMVVKNKENGAVVIEKQWCCWPVKFEWEPGYKYTYVIDLAQGGYYETNTADGDADLDPILENCKIVFATVTVDSWDDSSVDVDLD